MGWSDFELRSYDAQIGRFLQNDPYDQFASGYVGMGNDPANTIDRDGGWGSGIGCAATAGMAGYGGMASRAAAGGANVLGAIGKGAALLNTTKNVLSAVNTLNTVNGIKNSSPGVGNSGTSESADGGASPEDVLGGGDSPCNCPPGYKSTPKPGGDRTPYFTDILDAAEAWSYVYRAENRKSPEKASMIYSISVPKSTIRLYSYTPVFHNGGFKLAPGPFDAVFESSKPAGAKWEGHIHAHWLGSETKDPRNIGFSHHDLYGLITQQNQKIADAVKEIYLFVVGSQGVLRVRYPYTMPPNKDPWDQTNTQLEGQNLPLLNGFHNDGMKQPPICPCYKQ